MPNEKLEIEMNLLAKILYKSKNQHRNTLYYRKLKHFYKCSLKALKDPSLVPKARDLGLQAYCLIKTLVHQSFFLPFAITCLAVVSRIRKAITESKLSNPKEPSIQQQTLAATIVEESFEEKDLDEIFAILK